jgi:hypothetical protein
MERELKSTVVPWLRAMEFKGSFPHFRRNGQSTTDLFAFQFDSQVLSPIAPRRSGWSDGGQLMIRLLAEERENAVRGVQRDGDFGTAQAYRTWLPRLVSVISPSSGFDGRVRFRDHAASRMRSAMMPRVRKRWRRELVGMFRLRHERGCKQRIQGS